MLLVRTTVLPSKIQGLGLFAAESIPRGTLIWRFLDGFDKKFSRAEILDFPEAIRRFLCVYSWKSKKSGLYCLSSDNDRYCNHDDQPNLFCEQRDEEDETIAIALRDIQQGEELTNDYASFETSDDPDNVLLELARTYQIDEEFSRSTKEN